jgi:hypothetical protein
MLSAFPSRQAFLLLHLPDHHLLLCFFFQVVADISWRWFLQLYRLPNHAQSVLTDS